MSGVVSLSSLLLALTLVALGVGLGVALGVAVGLAEGRPTERGGTPRRRPGFLTRAPRPSPSPHEELGLLGERAAMLLLDEEVTRRAPGSPPLTVALLDVVVADTDLPPPGCEAANRAVARLVEARAGEHDVPFALAADRIGLVFPDAGAGHVWDVVDHIVDDLAAARFTYGDERTSRPLAPAVEVAMGITRQRHPASPDEVLGKAVSAVQRAGDSSAPGR